MTRSGVKGRLVCEPGFCRSARPDRCGCALRFMMADMQSVPVVQNGERATLIRVYWPDNSATDHEVR